MKRYRFPRMGLLLLTLFLAACGPQTGEEASPREKEPNDATVPGEVATPEPEEPPPPVVPPGAPPASPQEPLVAALWEASRPEAGRAWSQHAYDVIHQYGANLLNSAQDITSFCPAYANLSREQKISYWVFFVSAVTKYESGFSPTSRYHEKNMGTDPVTKLPVYSEGLLQLSYQDKLNYSFCNIFDWEKDKNLPVASPQKTILDPFKNLSCGIRILNQLVGKKKVVAYDSGHYWAVLKPNGQYGKIPQIKELSKQVLFCRK